MMLIEQLMRGVQDKNIEGWLKYKEKNVDLFDDELASIAHIIVDKHRILFDANYWPHRIIGVGMPIIGVVLVLGLILAFLGPGVDGMGIAGSAIAGILCSIPVALIFFRGWVDRQQIAAKNDILVSVPSENRSEIKSALDKYVGKWPGLYSNSGYLCVTRKERKWWRYLSENKKTK